MGFSVYWLIVKRTVCKYKIFVHWAPYPKVLQVLHTCPFDTSNLKVNVNWLNDDMGNPIV